ncbi:phosphotransferase [Candidatus Pacearchaeota archaeon]|nr:phosphotransferase [Candidatus Pacearchaeota archaeon]
MNEEELHLLQKVVRCYNLGTITKAEQLAGGLVNVSFKVESPQGDFVFQRLSPIWDERVIDDYTAVQRYLRTKGLHVPVLLTTKAGKTFQRMNRQLWRAFEYQVNDTFAEATPERAHEAGALLGRFHKLMAHSGFKPKFRLLGFHDTPCILEKLVHTKTSPQYTEKAREVQEEYEILTRKIPCFYLSENRQRTIIHGDPKLANFLFREGKAVSLLDLDTMMEESPLFDLGDALRSWCRVKPSTAGYNPDVFESAMAGYEKESPFKYAYQGINHAMSLVTLELAARYLIDYFKEDYFSFDAEKYQSRAEQNLARCRRYLEFQQNFSRDFRKFHVEPFCKSE